jgi:hypothetical protein
MFQAVVHQPSKLKDAKKCLFQGSVLLIKKHETNHLSKTHLFSRLVIVTGHSCDMMLSLGEAPPATWRSHLTKVSVK